MSKISLQEPEVLNEARIRDHEIMMFDINGSKYYFTCEATDTSTGFAHTCWLEKGLNPSQTIGYGKSRYYNRTWESFTYQSVMLKAIENAKEDYPDLVQDLDELEKLVEGGKKTNITEDVDEEEEVKDEISVDEIPDVAPEEPIVVSNEINDYGDMLKGSINTLVSLVWDIINTAKEVTKDPSFAGGYPEVMEIINKFIDEETINVGMLNKALEVVDSSSVDLMKQGEEKAEEIVSNIEEVSDEEEVKEEPVDESLSQETGKFYDDFKKKYGKDLNELIYGDEGFMKSMYPNGFPDFKGDVIYSEKYWNEFVQWAKDIKGIEIKPEEDTFEKQL